MNKLQLNGREIEVQDSDLSMTLLRFLRERHFLYGVKNGCEQGLCGSCTIVVDGKAMRSCKFPVQKAVGKSLITIEGMEYPDGRVHPIQQAFMDAGAIQCGFCTPGMVLAAYVLLLENPQPTREQIRKALRGNLCRCTGYQHIIDAVELAAKIMHDQGLPVQAGCLQGQSA
ncbi:MAG: (2Fe-2S)-binding protein [Spirochaetes bacterium]|nr:(2Fe-2S)-binding protein [Spirochaetota bacterium]MBU0956528.1 (2Fe-2S)-binding protein [Spirochaetota bacterium]